MVALIAAVPGATGTCPGFAPGADLRQDRRNCDILGHMAANLRFSTAIEALALMATEPEKFHTSQALASALATNPVVIRRLLSALSRAGLVTSAKGPSGGTHLAKSPKQITLRDIYRALDAGTCCIRPHTIPQTQRN